MAQPVTDKEIGLRKRARRRLVGAIALVLLVAVVLPWIVDDDPPPRLKNVDIAIPAVESVDRKFPPTAPVGVPLSEPAASGESPLPAAAPETATTVPGGADFHAPLPTESKKADAASSGGSASAPAGSAADTVETPAPVAPKAVHAPEPARKVEPKAEAGHAPKSEAKPEKKAEPHVPAGKGFVMQVGAFSSTDKAKQLQQQLRAAGFPAYLEPVKTSSGTRTRVRAGPFATVEAAQKARTKLLGLKVAQGDLKVVPREN